MPSTHSDVTALDIDLDQERRAGSAESAPEPQDATIKNKKRKRLETPDRVSATPGPDPMPASVPPALLICSIGNPGSQYAHTLHSAGHTIVSALRAHLDYPSFAKEKALGNGLVSRQWTSSEPDWTLWQSPSYMNESGPPVRKAWETWTKTHTATNAMAGGKLVVVHDELEKPLGSISVKEAAGLSARGHNGLKSILAHLGKTPFVRVGVGIGRPASRQSDDVARYVLRKMTAAERDTLEGAAEELAQKLMALKG